jgi:hypothetical protein
MTTREEEFDSVDEQPEVVAGVAPVSQEIVISPHDRLVNRTLQHIESARSLVQSDLPPELLECMKLESLAWANVRFRRSDREAVEYGTDFASYLNLAKIR